jgi:predicted CoA-binding protein
MATKRAIDSFLATRRLAVVGVSRDPKDFTRTVYRAFAERGYELVMFLPGASFLHRVHRFFRGMGGRYEA